MSQENVEVVRRVIDAWNRDERQGRWFQDSALTAPTHHRPLPDQTGTNVVCEEPDKVRDILFEKD